MHTFLFTWFKYNRYGRVFERKNKVTAQSLAAAIQIFRRTFGNEREACITLTQEIDAAGNVIELPVSETPVVTDNDSPAKEVI